MICTACQLKIKISEIVITSPAGDICRNCGRIGWTFINPASGWWICIRLNWKQDTGGAFEGLPLLEGLRPEFIEGIEE